MKKIACLVVLSVSSSMMMSAIPSESTNVAVADVLIYNGSGVWNDGVIAFERFLQWKGLSSFECDGAYIEDNELVGSYDVLFFPGGDFTSYANHINGVGLQHIRDFINAGGGYLGICGGGYFACDQVSWRGQVLDMPLNLFNGLGSGPITEIAPWLQYTMTSITMNGSHLINHYEPATESIVYYGGAAFYPYEGQQMEVIGSYDGYNNDTAILDFYFGNGRVLLCGPHPEIEEDSSRDDVTFADELFDLGTDWNVLWTGMDWLMGVPISEPPASLPPYIPEIDGPVSGEPGTEYQYTFFTTDPELEEMYFYVDWGDGTDSGWIGLYDSGETAEASHSWSAKGSYEIKVKAKDVIGLESDWSDPLPVSMPLKHQTLLELILEWILQLFGIIIP